MLKNNYWFVFTVLRLLDIWSVIIKYQNWLTVKYIFLFKNSIRPQKISMRQNTVVWSVLNGSRSVLDDTHKKQNECTNAHFNLIDKT